MVAIRLKAIRIFLPYLEMIKIYGDSIYTDTIIAVP